MISGKCAAGSRAARAQICDLLRQLRHVQSAAVVAVAALKHQNCELDADIALVLQRSVVDRLQDQIDQLESAVAMVPLHPGATGLRSARVRRASS